MLQFWYNKSTLFQLSISFQRSLRFCSHFLIDGSIEAYCSCWFNFSTYLHYQSHQAIMITTKILCVSSQQYLYGFLFLQVLLCIKMHSNTWRKRMFLICFSFFPFHLAIFTNKWLEYMLLEKRFGFQGSC